MGQRSLIDASFVANADQFAAGGRGYPLVYSNVMLTMIDQIQKHMSEFIVYNLFSLVNEKSPKHDEVEFGEHGKINSVQQQSRLAVPTLTIFSIFFLV